MKGGVDWLRHREAVLKPLLLPFAKRLNSEGHNVMVVEDGAKAHNNCWNHELFSFWEVLKLLDWPPKSPDINAIEHGWGWERVHLTKQNYFNQDSLEETEKFWRKGWEELP